MASGTPATSDAPPEAERFREVFGHFATGVAVVTAAAPSGTGGMTANAVCSLSLDPLLVLVCFENEARTLPLVREAGRFGVSVLRGGHEGLARRFASKMPEGEKLAGVAQRPEAGVPVLEEALAWCVCDLREVAPGGDHAIVIGEVAALGGGGPGAGPLIWYRGSYRELTVRPPRAAREPR